MNRMTRRALGTAAAAVAMSVVAPTAADAHGVCKATASPPASALLTISYAGAFDCSDNHPDIYVHACLQRSVSPLTGWETIHCTLGHASSGNHVHAVGSATEACLLGFYRTTAYGHNANFNHQAVDASPAVACLSL